MIANEVHQSLFGGVVGLRTTSAVHQQKSAPSCSLAKPGLSSLLTRHANTGVLHAHVEHNNASRRPRGLTRLAEGVPVVARRLSAREYSNG